MAGKKRSSSGSPSSQSSSIYNLKIFHFSKLYDSKTNNGPKARSGHRIVCNEKSMFAIGGFNPNAPSQNTLRNNTGPDQVPGIGTVFHEIWRFDFDSRKWSKLECKNLSKELASCAANMSGSLLFVYGGTNIPFGVKVNEEVYACLLESNPNTNVLEFDQINIEGTTKPPKQYGQSIIINGIYLYTVGGTDGFVYSMDIYRLDLRTKMWERLTKQVMNGDGPEPRYRQEVILYNDCLVVFGGGTSDVAFDLRDIPAFNLKTHRWEFFKTYPDTSMADGFPDNRRCHACVQNPHDPAIVFINGGVDNANTFNDTWKLDLKTLQWTFIRNLYLPRGIYFHTAATTPSGRMVIFGGVTQRLGDAKRTADVYAAWITIPKLKDACWDAILHYVHNGTYQLPNNLERIGLPALYETRLKQCL